MSGAAERRMVLGCRPGPLGEGAQMADQAGLDFVLLSGDPDHGPIGQDPLSVAAFLMTVTRGLGLAASVPTAWAPFNVARALASFDLLSGGRGGWLPVRGAIGQAQADEHLDVVLQLFDSWDDDALVFDKATAVFADRDKVRRIRHAGAFYTVDGPLNAPRPIQGHPVLFQTLDESTGLTDVALVDLGLIEAGPRPALPSPSTLIVAEVAVARSLDAPGLADRLAAAYRGGGCDGFLFKPADPLLDTAWLAETVIHRLQTQAPAALASAKGDFRTRLGLPRPGNRFAASASS